MLRKHFAMSGDNKPDYTITYHAPQHVPFFGGYAKNWVYGYPSYGSGLVTSENPIKFKVIGDKWNNGVGEWKFRLEDPSNKIYNGTILGKKMNDSGDILNEMFSSGFGTSDYYAKVVFDENDNIIQQTEVNNTNIITSIIFGEGIETINGTILMDTMANGQTSCTEITLPESVTLLTGYTFSNYNLLKSITVPWNVIRIDNLCNIDRDSLEEVILKPLTPPDASNTSNQKPLGLYYPNNVKDSLKIRVYADAINNYKNDSIWGYYSDLYDTINDTIVYYENGKRSFYTEDLDITNIEEYCVPRNTTKVYLPNSVTSIGDRAFLYCSELTSVAIPDSVTSIGENAFNSCSSLISVVWNAVNCSDFSSGLSGPFYDIRTKITSFEFGDSVEYIPARICYGMSKLTSITIPNSVISIGVAAFSTCSGLTSVVIGNSVTSIGNMAFYSCSGLTSVVWNVVNCSGFSADSDNHPFYNIRKQITSFEFGDSVENIPALMCYGMSKLTSITIPNSVISIGESAFYNCLGLTSITIPNSVTSIGYEAFLNCSGLTSIEIGNLVNSIGDYAFLGCSGLTLVTMSPTVPPSLGSNVFSNTHSNLQIYVPDESVDAYKNATKWSSYASKIKPISEKPV